MPAVKPSGLTGPSWPTATQAVADRQVTALSSVDLPLAGAGTLITVQVFPFQVAEAALSVITPFEYDSMAPTATHRWVPGQETP